MQKSKPGQLGEGITGAHSSGSQVSTSPMSLIAWDCWYLMVWIRNEEKQQHDFLRGDYSLWIFFPNLPFPLHMPFVLRYTATSSGLVILLVKLFIYLNCLALFCLYRILERQVTRREVIFAVAIVGCYFAIGIDTLLPDWVRDQQSGHLHRELKGEEALQIWSLYSHGSSCSSFRRELDLACVRYHSYGALHHF